MATYCVDFVDEDNAGHVLLGLVKQISYAACAHADEHFYKVTTADGEERHACLACDGFGKQRFTRSRRTYKQHAVRNTRADVVVLLRIFEEVDDFLQLFLFLVGTCNVGKTYLDVFDCVRTTATEIHVLVVLASEGTHQVHAQADDQRKGKQRIENIPNVGSAVVERVLQLGVGFVGGDLLLNPVVKLADVVANRLGEDELLSFFVFGGYCVEFDGDPCIRADVLLELRTGYLLGLPGNTEPQYHKQDDKQHAAEDCPKHTFASLLFQSILLTRPRTLNIFVLLLPHPSCRRAKLFMCKRVRGST